MPKRHIGAQKRLVGSSVSGRLIKSIFQKVQEPTLFAIVKELPKGALFEKQVQLHTGHCQSIDDEGETFMESAKPLFEQCNRDLLSAHFYL